MAQGAFAAVSELGPYFTVQRIDDVMVWRPFTDLLEPDVLGERVIQVRDTLDTSGRDEVDFRTAASTMSLGLFARLVSPVVGAHVLGVELPRPTLAEACWQPVESGPWPLALGGPPAPADPVALLEDLLDPVSEVLASTYSVSTQVLDGNVASAFFGAAVMVSAVRPDLSRAAYDVARSVLEGPLAGTGTVGARGFVRSSCCLFYRVPGGGYCGDCVLLAQ